MRPLFALAVLAVLPAAFSQVQVLDPLTITALRVPEPRSQVPFTTEVVPADAFADGSSLTIDDALRGSADFSLFRRNDSMTANPTTQGVSLRGLGPSGTSRSLVLLDGVPLNDPFGGWVAWSSVPVDSLSRVEIVPGGGASAWGNAALAGVIQLFSVQPTAGSGDAVLRVADFSTRSADVAQAVPLGPGTLELRGEAFTTGGVVLVAPQNRGPVDIDAASRHDVESARWRGTLGAVGVVVTLRRYDDWRDNGTPYQQNQIRQLLGSVALTGKAEPDETWNVTAYLLGQQSAQTFSSVNAARSAETPASDQFAVPATALGLAASSTWTDSLGGRTTLGADARDIRGETREDYLYTAGVYSDQRFAGGRQTFAGLFAERSQPLGASFHAVAGLRLDRWEDSDGHLRNIAAASGALLLQTLYPTHTGNALSPSAGVTWDATKQLQFHLSGQRAFRQPTLNELYRPFRQGNTTTLANAGLATEHADSVELGGSWRSDGVTLTLAGFAARLENAVSNVTLAQGPGTFPLFGTLTAGSIGQERLNLGRVDTEGVQLGLEWRLSGSFSFILSAIDEEATVAAAAVAPALVGNQLPEVPRWNASLGASWQPIRPVHLEARVRCTGAQYDDDQNLLPLAAATVVDAALRVAVSPHAEFFATVDNLCSARIETAHSALGVFNLAPPRMVGTGLRLSW